MPLFSSQHIFMVGIKGSGMSSLAIFLHKRGIFVSGWDIKEVFTTDSYLKKYSIPFSDTFPKRIDVEKVSAIIYSSAYQESHEIIQLAHELKIPIYSYYEALSVITSTYPSFGVSGTHGKTTSVASIAHILRNEESPCDVICGTFVEGYKNEKHPFHHHTPLIIEACEYQDHFLLLTLQGVFITNVELEHVDYFTSEEKVFSSFYHLIDNLPFQAPLIVNKDEKGIGRIIEYVNSNRKDITLITYGKKRGNFLTYTYPYNGNIHSFFIKELNSEFTTHLVGDEYVSDQIGASLLSGMMLHKKFSLDNIAPLLSHLGSFFGAKGRMQKISPTSHPLLIYTDYAHHPSEIRASLSSIRLQYPNKKIRVIFFPHTVSRMSSFFEEFISSLTLADELYIFPVALSARKDGQEGRAKKISKELAARCGGVYVESEEEAIDIIRSTLQITELCITMGAGNTHEMNTRLLEI